MTSELQTGRDLNEVATDSDKILELAWRNLKKKIKKNLQITSAPPKVLLPHQPAQYFHV